MTARARAIARTDLRTLRQSKDFWIPLAAIAAVMFVAVPALLLWSLSSIHDRQILDRLGDVVGHLPAGVRHDLRGTSPAVQASFTLAVYMFTPLVTLVPLTVSSAVAANTFVGERERGSGEFLAHSPASSAEIYLGKLAASLVPGFVTAGLGLVAYSIVVNALLGPEVGRVVFPAGNWWVLLLWMTPPVLVLAISVILVISSRVTSGAAAQQAASVVSLPLVVIAYGVTSRALFGSPASAWLVGAVAWVCAAGAVAAGTRSLSRERLLGVGG